MKRVWENAQENVREKMTKDMRYILGITLVEA